MLGPIPFGPRTTGGIAGIAALVFLVGYTAARTLETGELTLPGGFRPLS